MKKPTKTQISNLVLLVFLVVFLFTPVGTQIKVYINRIVALSPSVKGTEDRITLKAEDYQWKLQSITGERFDFDKTKGKVVLVNFWATWCPPCIAEMPSLQKLYNAYKDKVVFLFVSQESTQDIEAFMNKHDYDFPVYSPLSNVPKVLESSSIPTTYLIDPSGTIMINESGAANWNADKVHELLDNLLNK